MYDLVNFPPIQYVSLMRLRYYERMNIGEIAAQLNQPTGTVRSRLSRARHVYEVNQQGGHLRDSKQHTDSSDGCEHNCR